MGSVIDYHDCPNCGQEAWSDFYYKTGEEYINCNHCGYHRSSIIITKDKTLDQLTEADWLHRECLNPYGAFRYKMVDTVGYHCGTLETEAAGIDFQKQMELNEDNMIEFASMSRFVDGQIVETIFINNKTESNG